MSQTEAQAVATWFQRWFPTSNPTVTQNGSTYVVTLSGGRTITYGWELPIHLMWQSRGHFATLFDYTG